MKRNKKILYITTLFNVKNSSATIRNNILVKGLVENGCEVDVMTVQWPDDLISEFFEKSNSASSIHKVQLREMNLNANLKKINVKKHFFVQLKKTIKKIVFFPDICRKWKNYIDVDEILDRNYDLVISSSDHKSSHYIGEKLKQKNSLIKWIQIWGDPWEQDINTPFYLKFKARRKEKELLKQASVIFYVSLLTKEMMSKKYDELKNKMHYLPRGFYSPVIENHDIKKENFHIVYTGALGLGRDLSSLACVLEEYNQCPHERSILIDVYGTYTDSDIKKIANFASVKVHGSLSYENIRNRYAQADALIFVSNRPKTTQIPGKLYDYFGTTKPVICLVNDDDDEITFFLSKFKRCLVVENSKQMIKKNITNILEKINTNYAVDSNFSPQAISEIFLRHTENIR